AVDDQPLGPDALDTGAHPAQQAAQVLYVRLARGVEDLRAALRLHSRQKDVLRPGHRRQVEHDAAAPQTIGRGDDLVFSFFDVRAHLAQATEVLLHATRADVVAAGSRHTRPAETSEEGPEQHDGRAHPPAQLVGDVAAHGRAGVEDDGAFTLGPPAEL